MNCCDLLLPTVSFDTSKRAVLADCSVVIAREVEYARIVAPTVELMTLIQAGIAIGGKLNIRYQKPLSITQLGAAPMHRGFCRDAVGELCE